MTRSTRSLSAAALAAVGMMALASCAGQSGATPAADADPVQGGNLRVGILSDIGCIEQAHAGLPFFVDGVEPIGRHVSPVASRAGLRPAW